MKTFNQLNESFTDGWNNESKDNKHSFSKKAIALKKQVEKATGWTGGVDNTDSSSDLIRIEWNLRSYKELNHRSLSALSKLDFERMTITKSYVEVSVMK